MSKKYTAQLSFFDYSKRIEKVEIKDKLKSLNELIPWEMFREGVNEGFGLKGFGGRPSFDALKIFKVLILQRLYGLSDEEMEFSLNDRLSFQKFVGFEGQEDIPDAKTIWLYRERLVKNESADKLFNRFDRYLNKKGYKANNGVIIDATVVEIPQNISKETYQKIKESKPKEEIAPNKAERSQTDFDARYTSKDKGKTFQYGYKAHVRVCAKHKLIKKQIITEASRGDCTVGKDLIDGVDKGTKFYADSAYDTLELHEEIEKKKLVDQICKQTKRNKTHKVSGSIKKYNTRKSRIRCRCEHVFGHLKHVMKAGVIRCIGKVRATATIILNHLAYNLQRFCYLEA